MMKMSKIPATGDSGLPLSDPPRARWRILYSLLVMLFFVGVVPLLFTYWILIDMNRETLRTIQKERQLSIANFISETITAHVEESVGRIEAIAQAVENDRDFTPQPRLFQGAGAARHNHSAAGPGCGRRADLLLPGPGGQGPRQRGHRLAEP